jgi:uncharacterized protein
MGPAAAAREIARAREELRAAEGLLSASFVRVAASRLYYAVFHGARALLFAGALEAKTDMDVLSVLNARFVGDGRLDAAKARLFERMQQCRDRAESGDGYVENERGTRDDFAEATAFVERAVAMIGASS